MSMISNESILLVNDIEEHNKFSANSGPWAKFRHFTADSCFAIEVTIGVDRPRPLMTAHHRLLPTQIRVDGYPGPPPHREGT